jgi:hypothetical protein
MTSLASAVAQRVLASDNPSNAINADVAVAHVPQQAQSRQGAMEVPTGSAASKTAAAEDPLISPWHGLPSNLLYQHVARMERLAGQVDRIETTMTAILGAVHDLSARLARLEEARTVIPDGTLNE